MIIIMISLVFSVLFFSSPGKALLTGKGISRQVTTLRRKYSYLHNDTTTILLPTYFFLSSSPWLLKKHLDIKHTWVYYLDLLLFCYYPSIIYFPLVVPVNTIFRGSFRVIALKYVLKIFTSFLKIEICLTVVATKQNIGFWPKNDKNSIFAGILLWPENCWPEVP